MGRKSTYTEALAEEVCERIAQGETLRAICRDDHMPAFTAIYRWLAEHADFSERFAKARDTGFDAIAMEALEIANTPCMMVRKEESSGGKLGDVSKVMLEDALGHRKLQVWTRLQLLAKWSPRYREKTETAVTGADGGPIQITDDAKAAARLASILADASKRKADDDYSDLV